MSTNIDSQGTDEGFGNFKGSESVKVVVRIRPLSKLEKERKDQNVLSTPNEQHVQLQFRGQSKMFRYTASIDEDILQDGVFEECGVQDLIDSALDGYSATVFAYGQTGSGKTYTMAGVEDKLGNENWVSDKNDGLIPRSVRYMWDQMTKRP